MENTLLIPPEPPPSGRAKGQKRWNERTRTRTNQWDNTHQRLNQLEELIKKLIGVQIDRDEVHAKEL